MKPSAWLLGCCLAGLAACGSVHAPVAADAVQTAALNEQNLAGHWRLVEVMRDNREQKTVQGSDGKGLTVHFDEQGKRLSVLNGCNRMSTTYRIEQGRLAFGLFIATRRMCEPELMEADSVAGMVFQTGSRFYLESDRESRFLIAEQAGSRYRFVRTAE